MTMSEEASEEQVTTAHLDKYAFVEPNESQLATLQTILSKRIEDGQGECFLELGVGDGESPGLRGQELEKSVSTLEQLKTQLAVQLVHLRDRPVTSSSGGQLSTSTTATSASPQSPRRPESGKTRKRKQQQQQSRQSLDELDPTASNSEVLQGAAAGSPGGPSTPVQSTDVPVVREYLLRRDTDLDDFVDVRVVVVGNVDAGKSTLLGVLTHVELDNGRGLARLRLLRHKHEAETGRTSSVNNDILGFNASGQVVNKSVHGQLNWTTICKAAAKVITFIDLAGHERYLKTTIFGMTGHAPDYVMFIVGANAGVIGMAKEHLGLALALAIPVFVVVTKVDMCPQDVLQETIALLFRILKSPGCRKIPLLVSTIDDVICSATNFSSERMCPVFTVSSVTGDKLDLLKMFLNLLVPRSKPRLQEPAHFQVDDIFSVPGVGNIVSGTCLSGVIRVTDTLLLGPDPLGAFLPVQIRSIQRKRLPVAHVRGGQTASFALKKLRRNQLRKGIVLVADEVKPQACLEFLAEILILHHPSTISVGYHAMVHAGPVRQTAIILSMQRLDRLRTGDRDLVRFRFIKYPEYLYPGLRLIFREGKTKAVGTIREVFPVAAPPVPNPRSRRARKPVTTPTGSGFSGQRTPNKQQQPTQSTSDSPSLPAEKSSAGQGEAIAESPPGFAYSKQRKHFRQHQSSSSTMSTSTSKKQSSDLN